MRPMVQEDWRKKNVQSAGMHELGHALSIGWRDDAPIPVAGFACRKCYEVYSGSGYPSKAGGSDPTNETVSINNVRQDEWSVMRLGTADDARLSPTVSGQSPILLFSVEELSTADFEHIPSMKEEG